MARNLLDSIKILTFLSTSRERNVKKLLIAAALIVPMYSVNATTILYNQNFENPTGFVNDGGDVNINRTVNQLYGGQPAGFQFAQNFTVETLLVGGSQAWGTGFLDPQGKAGNYVLGMLSDVQDDRLGLAFDVGNFKFLNFQLDISSIDLDRWNGPFIPVGGLAPTFRLSLYDNPSGNNGLGSGNLLDSIDITGLASPQKNTFDWSNHTVALDATGNTNGNVILRIDLLSGGYAAMDNFIIAASDISGDVGGGTLVPEPSSIALLSLGIVGFVITSRRKKRVV